MIRTRAQHPASRTRARAQNRNSRYAAGERRRGSIVLEMLLAVPLLLIATLAVFEFGFLLLLHGAATTAAIEGVREAQQGASCNEVAATVQKLLAVHNLAVSSSGDVRVVCEHRSGGSTQVRNRGNTSIPCTPTGPSLSFNGEQRVTVCVRVSDGTAPVPDWLATFGFSLNGRTLQVSSLGLAE